MDLKAVSYLQLYSQSKAFEEITGKQLDTPVLNVYMKMWNNRLDADSNDYKLYVAKKDKLILGFVYCRFIKCQGKIYALIKALYVNPTHWGLGIGRGLLDKLFAEIDNRQVSIVSLFIMDQNRRAEHLYRHYGLKFDSVVKNIKVNGQEYYLRHMVCKRQEKI